MGAVRAHRARLGWTVPPVGRGVCASCHGPARHGARHDAADCWCCHAVARRLGRATRPRRVVVPVAAYRTGDALHAVLRGYKDGPTGDAREHFASALVHHLGGFLARHDGCIADAAGATWDSVAVVPSSTRVPIWSTSPPSGRGRPVVAHPLERVVTRVPRLAALPRVALASGAGDSGHLAPDPAAVVVSGPIAGRRVLLVDDTWVTGARLSAAAVAVESAGAAVVALVVAGRVVDSPGTAAARWWDAVEERVNSADDRCCLDACRWAAAVSA